MASSSQVVSNDAFEKAWADPENRKIMSAIGRRYKGVMDYESMIYNAQLALFYCLRKHRPDAGTKFTSSLTRHTIWQFKRATINRRKNSPLSLPENFDMPVRNDPIQTDVQECLTALPVEDCCVLNQRFFMNMTLREISSAHSCSIQGASNKVNRALGKFKELWTQGEE